MKDQLQRFIFETTDVRGELARLDEAYQQAISAHQYPEPVERLLGEFLVAATLMSATIKFEGILTLQAKSNGEVPLIMAEATSNHELRAIARGADDASSSDFNTLLKDGQLAISITPEKGQRYQGIVSLDGSNLADCLEKYFEQSEQLSTRIWLHTDSGQATGMLLQELPASANSHLDDRKNNWEHVCHLAQTLSKEEILQLDFETLLFRLYHQEQVRVFEPATLSYQCSCSRQRTSQAIKALGETEALNLLKDTGVIEVNCEFCNQKYSFNDRDIDQLFHPIIH